MIEFKIILLYFIILAVISTIVTVYDKSAAKLNKRRISEKALFIVAAIGGALPMFITMKTIRHKTRHKRFMLGLPVIILIHAVSAALYITYSLNH
ncbi:MAG: DUF1294 domain-containing protein [Clostridia bacterium]|nr:DUF1294 domain-containing protein [Clostridia bacterium]